MNLSGAGSYFSASHLSSTAGGGLHGHSYEVMAYWPADDTFDAEAAQGGLIDLLGEHFDHQILPPDLTRAEDIARAIGARLEGCVRVDVWRPVERYRVEIWL